jgi:peptide/nickel transport system permease protein
MIEAKQPLPIDDVPETASPWRTLVSAYCSNGVAVAALLVFLLICAVAILAPIISMQNPYDLAQLDLLDSKQPPGSRSGAGFIFLLGSDDQGRDLLSAIFYGLRISLMVGLVSTVIAFGIGAVLGLIAGYRGGVTEAIIMRVADLQLSFPAILLALILVTIIGQGVGSIIVALVTVQWAYYARTARSAALVERRKEYIEAAHCLKLSEGRILFRHLLPNCLPPLIVMAALSIASTITLEATLSFLGLGVPLTEPSLGLLIANGFRFLLSGKYWISFFPGLTLLLTILSLNLVADQLREVLNPRLQTL